MSNTNNQHLLDMLLQIGAVTFNTKEPYHYSSGLYGPIYCDNRLILSYPDARVAVQQAFRALLKQTDIRPEIIAGTATAGIPHATLLAHAMELPMIYVRSSAKAYGKQQRIEGVCKPGARVVLIEDLITTGNSALSATQALRDAGANVLTCLAIFSYNLALAAKSFEDQSIAYHALCTLDELLLHAQQIDHISKEQSEAIRLWQQDPKAWSKTFENHVNA